MSSRTLHAEDRGLRVQWADEAEAPATIAQLDGEAESNQDAVTEAWFPPQPKASRVEHCPSILQQALPPSPASRRRCYHETCDRDDDSEEKLEWQDGDARSCTSDSSSTCSWTCSDEETISSAEDFGDKQAMARFMKERGACDDASDAALRAAAPIHASSAPLSPVVTDQTTLNDLERCPFRSRLGQNPSPPLSPEEVSAGSSGEEGTSSYSLRCAFAPSDLSPEPYAVYRSKTNDDSYTAPQRYHHSSIAVHEPRARCGCRGLTVRVDSGPLGLSLEASYRSEQGFVLKQTWSDCAVDRGLFAHSIHVQNLPGMPGKAGDDHVSALDLGLQGRSSSSGLIRVRTVGLESSDGTTTVASSGSSVIGPPIPLRPGITSTKQVGRSVLVGVLEVEEGDILVRVDDVQVTKKCFTDVVRLLNEAKRPTRLAFVRHECGRRFVGREKGRAGFFFGLTSPAAHPHSPSRITPGGAWVGCCAGWRKSGCGCEQPSRAASVGPPVSSPSPQKAKSNTRYRQIEVEADGCPVAVLLRARRQLRSGGIGQWHEVVSSRGRLWKRLLKTLSPDSHSDRAKLRKLTGSSRSLEEHALPGMMGISKRKLMSSYQRLVSDSKSAGNGGGAGGSSNKASRALAATVWKDVNRTMSPRRPGGRPGFFSASQLGGGGFVCPAHFAGGSKHAVFRVAYATASTVQFVSGMSYMAALMLVREPVESVAYATLVTLLQERVMQALFPLGDVDLLDAYHLCGGRVVTFRASGASRSPGSCGRTGGGGLCRGRRYRCTERGEVNVDGVSVNSSGENHDANDYDGGSADRAGVRGKCGREEEPTQQVVIGEMLPRLVRAFGKALRRRLPALHKHLCKQAIPMSFLCAEWFTTAYARNTPLPLALCALDLFLVRLDDVMLRIGLAILEVLAPSLKEMNGLEILLQYGGLAANVCFEEVLRCMLATQPRQAPLLQTPARNPSGSGKRALAPCAVS